MFKKACVGGLYCADKKIDTDDVDCVFELLNFHCEWMFLCDMLFRCTFRKRFSEREYLNVLKLFR